MQHFIFNGKDGVWRWVRDFVAVSVRQRRRSYGIAGSEEESLKAIGRAFGKPSSSIYNQVAPHGGIRPADPPPFQWTPVVGSKSQEVSDGEGKAAFLYRGLQTADG